MADESKARQLHAQSLKLREGKMFLKSIQTGEEALFEYAKEKDVLGFAELLTMQAKTFVHAYTYSQFRPYLLLAKQTAKAAVDIAEKYGDESSRALPSFALGEVSTEEGDFHLAVESYKKAVSILETNPPKNHDRKSVLANFKIHLATAQYALGDTSALLRAEETLKELKKASDATDYEKHVWISGAHMRIANMLKNDDLGKAKEHLQKAKEIIDNDPDLVIRKEQWEKLAQML